MRPYTCTPSAMPTTTANVAVLIAFLLLSVSFSTSSSSATRKYSSGKRLGDFCQALVPTSVSSSSSAEATLPRSYYFCHPAMPNGFVECFVGRQSGYKRDHVAKLGTDVLSLDTVVTATATRSNATDASKADLVESVESMSKTAVVDEREFICGPGLFFNSILKACVVHPLSNCAVGFSVQPPSHEQLLCESYRQTLPIDSTVNAARLICHDKLKHAFVVCPLNAASAMRMNCLNGTSFSQSKQKCVEREEDSDCPMEWMEMAKEMPKAGLMQEDDENISCICEALLAGNDASVVYAAHPDQKDKFLTCVRNAEGFDVCSCIPEKFWNDEAEECTSTHFRRPVPSCNASDVETPAAAEMRVPAPAQHGCIDCDITPRQKCECGKYLQRTGKKVGYICDPDSEDRFLVCQADKVVCQPCAKGMKWNSTAGACGPVRKCDAWMCVSKPTSPPVPSPPKPQPEGQHGCIDCNITERQKCECKNYLKRSGKQVGYICDPESEDRFLVCHADKVICQPCAKGMKWNSKAGACGPVRKCDAFMCVSKPTSPPMPSPQPQPEGQHGCIDCNITERQKCECRKKLQSTGKKVTYICDPESDDRFLVCQVDKVICQPCAKGMMWNSAAGACGPTRQCDAWMCKQKNIVSVPKPQPSISQPDGQHGCIDCDITERQKCECRKKLQSTGKKVAYICDPDSNDRFLVCQADMVICQPCAKGMMWNSAAGACGPTRQCDAWMCERKKAPVPTPQPSVPHPDGQHGCIDCDITERQKCECRKKLQSTGKKVAYICDPDSNDRFLVCQGDKVVCQPCAKGMMWNSAAGACGPTHQCDPWMCQRRVPTPSPKPQPMPQIAPQPDGQHGCIDCEITERQKCECRRYLQRSGGEVAYICDPESEDRYLVCHADRVICQPCAAGMKWNSVAKACGPIRKCDSWLCVRQPSPVTTTTTRPTTTTTTTLIPVTLRQQCECERFLRRNPGVGYAKICDPESSFRYLICRSRYDVLFTVDVTVMQCVVGKPMSVCGWQRRCHSWLCLRSTTTTTTTTPCPTTTTTTTTTRTWTTTTPPPQPPPQCEVVYEYHPEKMNWLSAMRVCQAMQGTLLTIPTMEVQQYLRERFGSTSKSKRVWIGASDRNREGNWEWVTGERFGFTNWYRNQPSSKRDEDCLVFNYYSKGAWADYDCSWQMPFICQYIVCAKK